MGTPEQETLEKAAIKFAEDNFRTDQPMHIPYWLSKSFIAGADWERERAKVLVEAIEVYLDRAWPGERMGREALAKYRGGG